jgi:hypothetical protein
MKEDLNKLNVEIGSLLNQFQEKYKFVCGYDIKVAFTVKSNQQSNKDEFIISSVNTSIRKPKELK